jgi:DNA polymerase-3 subunit alpha
MSEMNETEHPKVDFIHLHVHSHYSLLNALPTPKELVHRAKEYDMPSLALTDNGALYGAVNFYKACTKENIKPIIGLDAYLAPRTLHDKDAGLDKPRGRVVFLAKNNNGYKNLIKMVTESYINGFYYKPRIDHALIEKLHEDLVCIIPSFSGEPVLALKESAEEKAESTLDWYKSLFGDDCYLGNHPSSLKSMVMKKCKKKFLRSLEKQTLHSLPRMMCIISINKTISHVRHSSKSRQVAL